MRKFILISIFALLAGLFTFVYTDNMAFAECMLDAEFTDSAGIGEPAINVSSDGKTVDGYLKVVNSDISSCPVKADLRVYSMADEMKKIVSKTVSFGSIAPGAEVIRKFTLSSKKYHLWGRPLAAVINPAVIQYDGDTFEEDDGSVSLDIPAPETPPDIAAEWGTLTLADDKKKVTGELIISNIGAQDSGKFVIAISADYSDGNTRFIKKININGLKAGESRTLKLSYSSVKSLEWATLGVHADYYDNIYETDEDNNMAVSETLWDAASCSERIELRGFERFSSVSQMPKVRVGRGLYIGGPKIINCGDTDLTITNVYTDSEELTSGYANIVLAPKKFRYLTITFNPAEKGIRTATMTIESDDPQTPVKTVTVAGIGL